MAYIPEPNDNEPETSALAVGCVSAVLGGIVLIVIIIEIASRI